MLRYDNLHIEAPDEYHRHLHDLETWEQAELTLLEREQLPTLGEVVQEVMELAEAAGLLPS